MAGSTRSTARRIPYGKTDQRIYSELSSDRPIDLTRYQVANCYMGRAGLINSGGASGSNDFAEDGEDRRHQQARRWHGTHLGPQGLPAPDGRGNQAAQPHPGRTWRRRSPSPDAPVIPATPLLRLLLGAAAVAIIVFALQSLAPVLTVFMVAIVVAESLAPVMQWFMRRDSPVPRRRSSPWHSPLSAGRPHRATDQLADPAGADAPHYQQQLASIGASITTLLTRAHVDTSHLSTLGFLDPNRLVGTATSLASKVILTLGRGIFVLLLVAFMLIDLAVHDSRKPGLPGLRWMQQTQAFGGEIRAYMRLTALMAFIGAVATWPCWKCCGSTLRFPGVYSPSSCPSFRWWDSYWRWCRPPSLPCSQFGWDRALMVVVGYVSSASSTTTSSARDFIKHGFEMNFVEMFFSLLFWGWVFGPVGRSWRCR